MDDRYTENRSKNIFKTRHLYLIPRFFIGLIIVCSIILNVYFVLNKDSSCETLVKEERAVQVTKNQDQGSIDAPKAIPQNIVLDRRYYHEVKLDEIQGFFDKETFGNSVLNYISNNEETSKKNVIEMKCTDVYSSDYPDYDDMGIYLDLSTALDLESLENIVENFNNYKLKDTFLSSFLEQKNKDLKATGIKNKVLSISSCDFNEDKKIVSYVVTEVGRQDLFIEYFENGKSVKIIQSTSSDNSVSIYDRVEPCEPKPYLLLSDNSLYYRCTTGDAGVALAYVFEARLDSGSFDDILVCLMNSDTGIEGFRDFRCWKYYKSVFEFYYD